MDSRARIEAAFEQALDCDSANRADFLATLRATDRELAAAVEQLLAAHQLSDGVLDRTLPVSPIAEERRIGPYRVVRELGRGGMGVVYLAERDDGQFRQRVAVKLLRASPDAEELHHRFLAERQILASLQHPHIAQLLDGGVTDGRLPYLVMEYVDGWPITEYCDRQRLDIRQRLRLFQDVCAAVQHAHRNLIIHRDLKPGNILVTQAGHVKLLDFGIAKLLNPELVAFSAPITGTAQQVLTPEYASPEQVRGEPLSTTSDVYALGVVLYELLAGCRPHDAGDGSPQQLARRISEELPEKPSVVCAGRRVESEASAGSPAAVARARDMSLEQLKRALRGDVDAIVLMALRKEPNRRYGSAELFAQDVQRHLDGLPVLAQRGSRRYHLQKFARRHRIAVAATALVAMSILIGAGITLRQSAIARAERDRAQQAFREAEEITTFLLGLFEGSDPEAVRGPEITARDLTRRGLQRVEQLHDQPIVQARMLDAIGRVHHGLGDYAQARALLERALSIRETHLGPNHADVAQTLTRLVEALRFESRFAEADAAALRALAIREQVFGPEHPEVARSLLLAATIAVYRADMPRAVAYVRRALAIREAAYGPRDTTVASALVYLGGTLSRRGEFQEAEPLLRRAIDIYRGLGPEHPLLANALMNQAYLLDELPGREAEADRLYQQGIGMRRKTLGADHELYAHALGDYAIFLSGLGRYREALPFARENLDRLTRIFGAEHPQVLEAMSTYIGALQGAGHTSDAIDYARKSLDLRGRVLGENNASYARGLTQLALLLSEAQPAEAEKLLLRAIAIHNTASGRESGLTALAHADLATIQMRMGRFPEAEQSLLHVFAIYQNHGLQPTHRFYQDAVKQAVALYDAIGNPTEAARYRRLLR